MALRFILALSSSLHIYTPVLAIFITGVIYGRARPADNEVICMGLVSYTLTLIIPNWYIPLSSDFLPIFVEICFEVIIILQNYSIMSYFKFLRFPVFCF